MIEAIGRWRHGRGYGVHSPFGYELVTRCVNPKGCCWYGYAEIEDSFGAGTDARVRREARMLLRLMTMLRPREVFLPTGANIAYQAAIHAYDSRARVRRVASEAPDCDLTCSVGAFLPVETLCRGLETPGNWLALKEAPEGWADILFDALPEGLMFRGKRNLLLFHHPGMQKICYTMPIG